MRVFLATTMASQAIGSASSWGPDKAKCELATRNFFGIIDSVSPIDPIDGKGDAPERLEGRVELRKVTFAYPSRPEARVLDNFSLVLEPGTTTALVGESGSGKSSVVALLLRFYDVADGAVLVDGADVRSLSVKWLRGQTGLVQQEPSLFSDSIAYNIAYGRVGEKPEIDLGIPQDAEADSTTAVDKSKALREGEVGGGGEGGGASANKDKAAAAAEAARLATIARVEAGFVVDADVRQAAKDANALGFVDSFRHKFATHCGARGSQLSGGQKQRVAIARACIRNPRLLLLDEATSALDSESERIVQAALDDLLARAAGGSAAERRTTLVVAHRLSTIKAADVIVVMAKGRIVERGSFAELMARPEGAFRKLADAQAHSSDSGAPAPASAAVL